MLTKDDKFFANAIADIREHGYESEYARFSGIALKTSDPELLAKAAESQRQAMAQGVLDNAGLAEAIAITGLNVMGVPGVKVTSHRLMEIITPETVAYFGDPQSAKGISRNTFVAMHETGLIDYQTFDQVRYAATERQFDKAQLIAGVASLGVSTLANPRAAINGIRGAGNLGLSGLKLGVRQLENLASIGLGKLSNLMVRVKDASFNRALVNIESQIVKSPIEIGVIVDDAGKAIVRREGTASKIVFSPEDLSKISGNTVTHNHPSGMTFSDADIALALGFGAKSIRAVGEDLTYVLKFDKSAKGFPTGLTPESAHGFLDAQRKALGAELRAEIASKKLVVPSGMTEAARKNWALGVEWQRLAERVPGISYEVIPTKK